MFILYSCDLILQCSYKSPYIGCFWEVLFYQIKVCLTNIRFKIWRIRWIIPYYFELLLFIVIIIIISLCLCVCVCVYFLLSYRLLLIEQNSKCNVRDQVSDGMLRKFFCVKNLCYHVIGNHSMDFQASNCAK